MGIRTPVPISKTDILNGSATISIFGKPHDFAIQDFSKESDFQKLFRVMDVDGVTDMWAPDPRTFSGKIAYPAEFRDRWCLQKKIIHIGPCVDGVIFGNLRDRDRRRAFFIATGDCPTLIVYDSESRFFAVAHAGKYSLLDAHNMFTGTPQREHESVVDSIMSTMGKSSPSTMHVYIVCGISAENYAHPKSHTEYGVINTVLFTYIVERYGGECFVGEPRDGCLDLCALIRAQLAKYDISQENIVSDGFDTFGDVDKQGQNLFWSHRRGDRGRNGIFVVMN